MIRCWNLQLAVALALLASHSDASSKIVLDLSHQSHLKPSTLAEAIRDSIDGEVDLVVVDVSFSELGNDGLEEVVSSLKSTENMKVDLTSRMNRLTPSGASSLIQGILGSDDKNKDQPELGEEAAVPTHQTTHFNTIDLSWNSFHPEEPGAKRLFTNLRKLVSDPSACPQQLRLDRCGLGPAACRSLGKGIASRHEHRANTPLSLHLCGNPDVGDAGIAAMAAAIRSSPPETLVFDVLDLSACDVGDAGAEALALALESNPGCIRHLDLSNNKIGNDGAAAISRALESSSTGIEVLNLDNNPDIGNAGASALADTIGVVKELLSLRSCSVQADGMEAFGKALKSRLTGPLQLDLSGNPVGILRKKKKEKKYSASALKSKASATTASYMNFIGKKIQSGLKDVGLDGIVGNLGPTDESDDDEEARTGVSDSKQPEETDPSKARCGAKAFASAVIEADGDGKKSAPVVCRLGMRRCFLDQGAADALAATIRHAKEQYAIKLLIDTTLNTVLEDNMVDALRGKDTYTLEDMSDRHMEALEVLRAAEERAEAAANAARQRKQEEWEQGYFDDDDAEDDAFGGNFDFEDPEPDQDPYDDEDQY